MMKSKETPPFLYSYNQRKLKTGFLLDNFLNLFCRNTNKQQGYNGVPKKILVIQSHLIGDVMMAIPFLRALRRRYPAAELFLVANPFAKDLLEGQDIVDHLLTVPFPWGIRSYSVKNILKLLKMILRLRRERFDLAIDAQIDFRNIFFMFLTGSKRRLGYDIVGGRLFLTDIPVFPKDVRHLLLGRFSVLSYLGITPSEKRYNLTLNTDSQEWVKSFLKTKGLEGHQDIIAIHPGASTKEKLWPNGRFVEVINFLLEKKFSVVLIEGPQDAGVVKEIFSHFKNEIPVLRTSLKHLLAFFAQCRMVICLDSAASHLASAVGTPTVVLYGPQWPFVAKPFDENIVAVWVKDLACRPCIYRSCKKNHECMDKISVQMVLCAVNGLLEISRQKRLLNAVS